MDKYQQIDAMKHKLKEKGHREKITVARVQRAIQAIDDDDVPMARLILSEILDT